MACRPPAPLAIDGGQASVGQGNGISEMATHIERDLATPPASRAGFAALQAAFRDIIDGVASVAIWREFAWEDISSRFKRSYIGIFWTTISFAFFVAVKLVVFGPINNSPVEYFAPYVALGYFVWMFVNASMIDSAVVFFISEGWIKGARMPLSLFVCQSIARTLYLTFYNFLVVVGVIALARVDIGFNALWAIPAFALAVMSSFFMHLLLGIISVRFRDVQHLVQTVMRVMFFLTPIFWFPEQIGPVMKYLYFNPFLHYVEAFRQPLLNGVAPLENLMVVAAMTAVLGVMAVALLAFARRRIVFWL